INDTTKITFNGSGKTAGTSSTYVAGSPLLYQDPSLNSASLTTFGDMTFDGMTALATKILQDGTYTGVDPSLNADGSCNKADQKNWGDPSSPTTPCGSYWPIVWIQGNSSSPTVNGNHGQGILLISGDLNVQGGFEWYGPVLIRGHLKTAGTGGHFNGGVIA